MGTAKFPRLVKYVVGSKKKKRDQYKQCYEPNQQDTAEQ